MRLLSIVMLLMNIPALVLLWPVYVGMNALMFSQLEPYEIQLPTFAEMALGIPGIWIGLAGGVMGVILVAVQLFVPDKRVATIANVLVAVVVGIFLAVWVTAYVVVLVSLAGSRG